MRNVILFSAIVASILFTSYNKPNAEDILKKSFEKCQSIRFGYYEMTKSMKNMTSKDTVFQSFKCNFKKLKNDTVFSSAFHYQRFVDNEYKGDVLYSEDDFVRYNTNDSTGTLMNKEKWAENIKSISHNFEFYSPFTSKESFPLPNENDYDDRHKFKLLGEVKINGQQCYHIKMGYIPEKDEADMITILNAEYNFIISKKDYIPLKYSVEFELVLNNDTMIQYEEFTLSKYKLNELKTKNALKLSSIPDFIKLTDYKPYKRPELLEKGSKAPDWELKSLNDKTIKLSDFEGQIVLIDFFYKSCYPCMLALPAIQKLHDDYKDKGLTVIGINPYDTKEKDEIDKFLAKRGITYTVVLKGKKVAKEYHVSGYPTIYLIDKEGNVLFTQRGYAEGIEDDIEEVIKENL